MKERVSAKYFDNESARYNWEEFRKISIRVMHLEGSDHEIGSHFAT